MLKFMGNILQKTTKIINSFNYFVAISLLIFLFSRYKLGDKVVIYIIFDVFLFCVPQTILFVYNYIATKDITTDTVVCFVLLLFISPILFIIYIYLYFKKSNQIFK